MTLLKNIRTPENKAEMRRCYTVWHSQTSRCSNPKNNRFNSYGKLGVRVEYTFEEFWFWWCENHPRTSEKWTVGRINHSKNYSLTNIEFQTDEENMQEMISRRGGASARVVLVRDKSTDKILYEFKTAKEAAKVLGVGYSTVLRQSNKKNVPTKHKFYFEFRESK